MSDKEEIIKDKDDNREVKETENMDYSIIPNLIRSLRLLAVSLLLCGLIYTAIVTGIGELIWKDKARGSLIEQDGEVIGSRLIGQMFDQPYYFHPRVSSKGYDGMDSGSKNLGPTNPQLTQRIKRTLNEMDDEGMDIEGVPAVLVTESGSSLDPHITPEAALMQVSRVSQASGIPENILKEMIKQHIKGKLFGLFGLPRVNVLTLNLEVYKSMQGG